MYSWKLQGYKRNKRFYTKLWRFYTTCAKFTWQQNKTEQVSMLKLILHNSAFWSADWSSWLLQLWLHILLHSSHVATVLYPITPMRLLSPSCWGNILQWFYMLPCPQHCVTCVFQICWCPLAALTFFSRAWWSYSQSPLQSYIWCCWCLLLQQASNHLLEECFLVIYLPWCEGAAHSQQHCDYFPDCLGNLHINSFWNPLNLVLLTEITVWRRGRMLMQPGTVIQTSGPVCV